MRNYIAGPLALVIPLMAFSQQVNSFQGKWAGTMVAKNGGEVSIELVINEAAGTWRLIARGMQGKNNQCFGKNFPVKVISHSETGLELDIDGASVLQGCIDQTATLKSSDNKTLEGALRDGRTVKVVRQ